MVQYYLCGGSVLGNAVRFPTSLKSSFSQRKIYIIKVALQLTFVRQWFTIPWWKLRLCHKGKNEETTK